MVLLLFSRLILSMYTVYFEVLFSTLFVSSCNLLYISIYTPLGNIILILVPIKWLHARCVVGLLHCHHVAGPVSVLVAMLYRHTGNYVQFNTQVIASCAHLYVCCRVPISPAWQSVCVISPSCSYYSIPLTECLVTDDSFSIRHWGYYFRLLLVLKFPHNWFALCGSCYFLL